MFYVMASSNRFCGLFALLFIRLLSFGSSVLRSARAQSLKNNAEIMFYKVVIISQFHISLRFSNTRIVSCSFSVQAFLSWSAFFLLRSLLISVSAERTCELYHFTVN